MNWDRQTNSNGSYRGRYTSNKFDRTDRQQGTDQYMSDKLTGKLTGTDRQTIMEVTGDRTLQIGPLNKDRQTNCNGSYRGRNFTL